VLQSRQSFHETGPLAAISAEKLGRYFSHHKNFSGYLTVTRIITWRRKQLKKTTTSTNTEAHILSATLQTAMFSGA